MRLDRLLTLYFFKTLRRNRHHGVLRIPILMYHGISGQDEPGRHPYYQTNTRPDVFARHMQFLADNNYKVISLSTAVSLLGISQNPESGIPNPPGVSSPVTGHWSLVTEAPRYAVLTWDDGYRDFYDTAWPILKKHGFTATMFLPTGFIGNVRSALNGKDCLTWGEVRALAADGAAFGAHTVSHVQLYELYKNVPEPSFLRRQESTHNDLSLPRKRASMENELQVSKKTIEAQLGRPVEYYSYAHAFPEQDQDFVNMYETSLQAAGYRAAVSTRIGIARLGDNPFILKRLPVNSHDDEEFLLAKLEGGFDWMSQLQQIKKKIRFTG